MLKPIVLADHEAVSHRAAEQVIAALRDNPSVLVCLASGGTPSRTYELLAAEGARRPQLFATMRVLKLDEWGGLPEGAPGTCEHHLRSTLIDPLGLGPRYTAFASSPAAPAAECARMAAWLASHGPIDVCLLGLGVNGHLGFNEPADALQPHAHVATLSSASLGHAMIGSTTMRPTYGLTLGMADLLQARQVLLLVTGAAKREPLARLLEGRITTMLPASLLHLHANAMLLCDEAACTR